VITGRWKAMSRTRTIVLLASGILAGSVLGPPGIAAARSAAQQVFVTNTSANPVPVEGTVGVEDDRIPFETRLEFEPHPIGLTHTVTFQVPADKRLVVEFVSARVAVPSNQTPELTADVDGGGYAVPLTLQGPTADEKSEYAGALQVLDFAEPGSTYRIDLVREVDPVLAGGSGRGFVYLSGYLVPA
jgi:hypothetical protein